MSRKILNGWKEIAHHIQRSVRTSQRWEVQMGMPVHRPARKESGVVIAFTDELDSWICRTTSHPMDPEAAFTGLENEEQGLLYVLEDMSTLVWDTAELASRMRLLQEQLRQSLRLYHHRFASRSKALGDLPQGLGLGSLLKFPAAAAAQGRSELAERSQVREPHSR